MSSHSLEIPGNPRQWGIGALTGAVVVAAAIAAPSARDALLNGVVDGAADAIGDNGQPRQAPAILSEARREVLDNPGSYEAQLVGMFIKPVEVDVSTRQGRSGLIGLGSWAVGLLAGNPKASVTFGSDCLDGTLQAKRLLTARDASTNSRDRPVFDPDKRVAAIKSAGQAPRLRFSYPEMLPASRQTEEWLKHRQCPNYQRVNYPYAPPQVFERP